MCSDRLKKNSIMIFLLTMSLFLILAVPALAIEGKPGETIKTIEELKSLQKKGLLCQGWVNDLTELIDNGYGIDIVETTDRTVCHSDTFMEVSRKNKGAAKIGSNGELLGYKGGRPFIDLTIDDPQIALKAVWNFEFRYKSDQFTNQWNYFLTDANGNVKKLWGVADNAGFNYRTDVDPMPVFNPKEPEVRNKYIIHFEGPFESKGLGQLAVKYTDPDRDSDVWTYVPGLRRASRTGAGSGCDALGGFVSTMDDDYGFNGNVGDFTYKFIREAEMLVPTITPPGKEYKFPIPEGLHCHVVKMEKRKVWVIEQRSKDPDYCYSLREWFLDPETFWMLNVQNYDQAGNLWKNYWLTYSKIKNKASAGGGYCQGLSMGGCTDYRIWEGGPYITNQTTVNIPYKPGDFSLDAMRRRGR